MIAHVTSAHPATDIRIFVKQCKSLKKADFKVSLIVPKVASGETEGINIIGVNSDAKGRIGRMTQTVYKVYKACLELDADSYHFHDPELIPVGLALKAKGKKVIYDVHEDVPRQIMSKYWIPTWLRKPVSMVVEVIEKFAAKRFDFIVTATPKIEARFKAYNKNTLAIQNFPLLNELAFDDSEPGKKEVKENYIIYMGGITIPRGTKEMIKALEKVNEKVPVKLLLGGKFSPASLQSEIEQMPGWQHVEFLGWMNRQEVKEKLAQSLLGLVLFHPEPNHIDAQPNKLFEYMSAGLPVVTSNFPLWQEIVDKNNCGITVDPLDVDAIAEAILQLINNKEEGRRLGAKGRVAVEEKYNWQPEEKKLIKLYQGLLK